MGLREASPGAGFGRIWGRGRLAGCWFRGGRTGYGAIVRTGNEPMTARSALRLRLGLAIFGAVACAAAAIVLGVLGHAGWAIGLGVVAFVACVNVGVVVARIKQEPHYPPGPDIPPYEAPRPVEQRPPHPLRRVTRKRLYFAMMGICLLLVVLAWTLIYRFSTTAAVVMSLVALVIPPFAVIVANAGEPGD